MAKPATKAIGKKQKGLLSIIANSILKPSLITGIIIGVGAHEYVERAIDTILYKNVPVAETSYQDPRGVDVKVYTNEHGQRQTYIVGNGENPVKVPFDKRVLPKKEYLEPALTERYKEMSAEEAEDVLPFAKKRLEIIYEKIKPESKEEK